MSSGITLERDLPVFDSSKRRGKKADRRRVECGARLSRFELKVAQKATKILNWMQSNARKHVGGDGAPAIARLADQLKGLLHTKNPVPKRVEQEVLATLNVRRKPDRVNEAHMTAFTGMISAYNALVSD